MSNPRSLDTVSVTYCCITGYHKLRGFKEQVNDLTVSISQESRHSSAGFSAQGYTRLPHSLGQTCSIIRGLDRGKTSFQDPSVVGRTHFPVVGGVRFLFSCWLSAGATLRHWRPPHLSLHDSLHRLSHNMVAYRLKASKRESIQC